MTLEEVIEVIEKTEAQEKTTVRLHTGDPCIYGAIREQMDILDEKEISYDYCPGVSAFCGAASALNLEYTLPDISQSVIITRMEGRTPVPSKESIQSFAAHQATMVVFLSTGMLEELSRRLIEGGYTADTPAAIVYKATWPGTENLCLHSRNPCKDSGREQHHQNSSYDHWRHSSRQDTMTDPNCMIRNLQLNSAKRQNQKTHH